MGSPPVPQHKLIATQAYTQAGIGTVAIAKELGVCRNTIRLYKKALQSDLCRLDPNQVALFKEKIEGYFLQRSVKALDSMSQEKFDKAPLDKLAFVSKILNDAYRLSSNQSTSNVSIHVSGVVEEIERQRKKEYTKKK